MRKALILCVGLSVVFYGCAASPKNSATTEPEADNVSLAGSDTGLTEAPATESALVNVPKNTKFDLGEASPSDQTVIEQAITDANAYFESQGYSAGTVTVSMVVDKSQTSSRGHPDAQALVVTAGSDWANFGKADKYKLFAHEYYHVLQFHLSQGKSTASSMALWLKEGSAEYIGRKLAETHGYPIFTDYTQQAKADARASTLSLSDLEDSQAYAHYQDLYGGLGYTAVDYLVQQHGEAALFKFWSNLAKSSDWKAAFQSTFGESADSFYQEVEGS